VNDQSVCGESLSRQPFDPVELVARVKANLRRRTRRQIEPGAVLRFPGLEICTASRDLLLDGVPISLTSKEYDLLLLLAGNPDQVFSQDEIYRRVWHADSHGDTRTVLVHISNLRHKLTAARSGRDYSHTVREAGYMFSPGH
jgi:DNA-binding response OmpR family regulator